MHVAPAGSGRCPVEGAAVSHASSSAHCGGSSPPGRPSRPRVRARLMAERLCRRRRVDDRSVADRMPTTGWFARRRDSDWNNHVAPRLGDSKRDAIGKGLSLVRPDGVRSGKRIPRRALNGVSPSADPAWVARRRQRSGGHRARTLNEIGARAGWTRLGRRRSMGGRCLTDWRSATAIHRPRRGRPGHDRSRRCHR